MLCIKDNTAMRFMVSSRNQCGRLRNIVFQTLGEKSLANRQTMLNLA